MADFIFNLNALAQDVTESNISERRKKIGNLLIYACFFTYMMSMSVKGIVAAETGFLKEMWSLTYTQTSLSNAFYFVIYGLVQIGLFIFMKKINIRKYLVVTIPISAVCVILMGTSNDIVQMWVFYGLMGAFQAGLFSGCNSTLTACLPTSLLSKGNRYMNLGYAAGTVLAYALCGICVSNCGWRIPYFVLGALFLISFIIFIVISGFAWKIKHINDIFHKKDAETTTSKAEVDDDEPIFTLETKKKKVLFYIIVLSLTFLITALYYCIMNNVTLLLKDVHGLPDDISIYVSVLAPVTIAIGPMMTISACNKDKNFVRQAVKFMFIVLPIPLLLMFFYKTSIFIALPLTIIYVILTNGLKSIAISIITFMMRKQINAGAYSAISNAVASIAAGVMPVIVGALIDFAGWQLSYLVTFIVALVLTAILIIVNAVITKAQNRKQKEQLN